MRRSSARRARPGRRPSKQGRDGVVCGAEWGVVNDFAGCAAAPFLPRLCSSYHHCHRHHHKAYRQSFVTCTHTCTWVRKGEGGSRIINFGRKRWVHSHVYLRRAPCLINRSTIATPAAAEEKGKEVGRIESIYALRRKTKRPSKPTPPKPHQRDPF